MAFGEFQYRLVAVPGGDASFYSHWFILVLLVGYYLA